MERGHILLMSPKGHPEVAGCGIEFAWGHAKNYFRQNNPLSAAWGKSKLIHVQVFAQGGRRTPEVLRDLIPFSIHAVVAVGEELGVEVRPCWGC